MVVAASLFPSGDQGNVLGAALVIDLPFCTRAAGTKKHACSFEKKQQKPLLPVGGSSGLRRT
jgi:hypothetical protein